MDVIGESIAVEREIAIAASPETVWTFLVDPDKVVHWMGLSASFDPRPGGQYRVEVNPGRVATGEFVEVEPPRLLVLLSAGLTSSLSRGQVRPRDSST